MGTNFFMEILLSFCAKPPAERMTAGGRCVACLEKEKEKEKRVYGDREVQGAPCHLSFILAEGERLVVKDLQTIYEWIVKEGLIQSAGWRGEDIFRQAGAKFPGNPDGFQENLNLYGGKYTDQTPDCIYSARPKGNSGWIPKSGVIE